MTAKRHAIADMLAILVMGCLGALVVAVLFAGLLA